MTDYKKYNLALKFATAKHKGQYRKGGLAYITHPIAVAEKLSERGYGEEYVIAGLFHDLLEDTNATEQEIEQIGGKEVLKAVKLLTKQKGYVMEEYVSAIKANPIARAVKAMDRVHNLECAVVCSEDFKRRYILETIDYYMDLDEQIPSLLKRLASTMQNPLRSGDLQYEELKKEEEFRANSFILHGDICYSLTPTELKTFKGGYAVCVDGVSKGVFESIPKEYENLPVHDYKDKLIIPGLVDLHIHAPQYAFRGMGMDLELMDWLKEQTFPEESKYSDLEYAKKAYGIFASAMQKSATTHAVIFATKHRKATEILMELLENTGIVSYVGKVNMDREAPDSLKEESADMSAYETFGWINAVIGKYTKTKPILTPRFIPCCSPELLEQLREIQITYDLPVQSHLSENQGEIDFVRMLCPQSEFYGDAYDDYGLFGAEHRSEKPIRTVMAHCVYSSQEEMQRMKDNGVFVAHCPASNVNLSSGIAPIRKYLQLGLKMGLGSDVAGGHSESMLRAVCDAVQVSKLYWRLVDNNAKPLSFKEAFYLATKSGGEFFGKVGSLEEGYSFSAVVINDSVLAYPQELSIEQRLESSAYSSIDNYAITAKYVEGDLVFKTQK